MEEMALFLKRSAEKCGFFREHFREKNIPTQRQNIQVFHFFGDYRSEFLTSSLLLRRYKEEVRGNRYLIVCSWTGHQCLYPYADEYWSPEMSVSDYLRGEAVDSTNYSDSFSIQQKNLNWSFDHVATFEDLSGFYDYGLTGKFFDKFQKVKRTLPNIASMAILDQRMIGQLTASPAQRILILPTKKVRHFVNKKLELIRTGRDFWIELGRHLLKNNYMPVFASMAGCHDLSADLQEAIHCRPDMGQFLALARSSACILDVFNGSSKLALAARAPFVAIDERTRYMAFREDELDYAGGNEIPRKYIFSFPTIIENGSLAAWKWSFFDGITARLPNFLATINRDRLPTTQEKYEEVSLDGLKEKRTKKLGLRFIKIQRD